VLGDARLVTLTGPGGSGKTRLANEAAATLVDAMPDGVWLAELGPVVDPVDLPQAVLSLFGARELGLLARRGTRGGSGPVPPRERIVEAIGDKQLLLVMDNCEHLVTPAAALIDLLLARCPRLRVLATSREPLGITGEVLHPVGPLGMPSGEEAPAEVLGFPAVRLFADRGAAARPGFAVDRRTVAAVLDICRRLDGIPLAIELAAARLRALSPDQIAARLDDRFRLLAGGSRAALPRHQTLRAVVDWSWDLLSDPERVLARRLAVFPGGATLDAAEWVCAGPELGGLDRDEVLWLLAALVEKSLVVTAEDGAEVRYSMLETMRAYGQERRQEAGEEEALRGAHAGYFLALAEEAEPHLRRAEQLDWIHRLTAERENLHGALRWAIDSGDAELAMRLVASMAWYWFLQSARAEGAGWARQALEMPGQVAPVVRAQGYVAAALTVLSGGEELKDTLEYLDRAIASMAAAPHDDPRILHPTAVLVPVMREILHGEDDAALDLVEPMATHPDPWIRALAPFLRAQLLINFGEGRRAAELLDQAVERFRALGERWGMGLSLFARVDLSAYSADQRTVIPALVEAKETLAMLGDREDVGHVLGRLAWVRAQAGDLDGARRDLAEAERITRSVGATEERLYLYWVAAQIARREGDLATARAWLDKGIEDSMEGQHPYGQLHASLLTVRGYLDLDTGDAAGARDWCERSLVVALRTRDRPVIARARELLAAVELADGRAERAAVLLGNAAKLRGMPDEADPDVLRVRAAARGAGGGARRRGHVRRRNAWRASGANTTAIARPQASAPRVGRSTGPPTIRPRIPSVSSVTGLTLTQACIQPGMVPVGTNALEAKVSGKITVKPKIWTFSGWSTSMPISTGSQENASVKATSRATAPSASSGPVWTRKPSSMPTPIRMAIDQTCRATSAAIRPASGADLAIGRLRKRSNTPLVMSVFSATAVFMLRNSAFCTMIPASPNSRNSLGEPDSAPPNTKANSSTNISGWRLRSSSSIGLWRICTRLRQERMSECLSAPSGPTPVAGAGGVAGAG
jgi:predicted ATPase